MATVQFLLRKKSDNAQIFVRVTYGRQKQMQAGTGLFIDAADWSDKNRLPKQNNPQNKRLATDLKQLDKHLYDAFNRDNAAGVQFSTDWLKTEIDLCFGRIDPSTDSDEVLTNYLRDYIEFRKLDNKTKSCTDRKFYQLLLKIERFEQFMKRRYLIKEIDRKVILEFRKWLIEKDNLMESTANARLKNLKTVLLDARDNGKTINHQVNSYSIASISAEKVFLNFAEIELIKNTQLLGDDLNRAKDWLIIGCYTGQRIGDLLRMNTGQIFTKTDNDGETFRMIELTQEKTGQEVTIPIHDEVETVLNKYGGNFPPTFGHTEDSSHAIFNRLIKRICEVAGIRHKMTGKVYNSTLKKNEIKETEKFNLVSSHICRRSFATNFYGDSRFSTPQLMAITGHKSEKVFLSYIGKVSADHALKTARTFRETSQRKQFNP